MRPKTRNANGLTGNRPNPILFVTSLLLGAVIAGCSHDRILRPPPPNPNGNWHGYISCGGQLGDFGFTIAVDSVGSVTGTGGEACHLSVATFTVTGNFINPDMSLTMTWREGGNSFPFVGTLQADTIFVSSSGPAKLVRLSQ